jgi:hypothetical protein
LLVAGVDDTFRFAWQGLLVPQSVGTTQLHVESSVLCSVDFSWNLDLARKLQKIISSIARLLAMVKLAF